MEKYTEQQTEQHEPTQTVTENNCNVTHTQQLISDLYKNVTMAQNAIKTLLPYVKEQDATKSLHKQVEQYDHYIEELGTIGQNLNFDPTPAPKMSVAMAGIGIRAKMIADQTLTHVAKIMLQGTLNGVIDLYRLIRQNPDVHPDVMLTAKQILRFEESCLENMKAWL